MSEELPVRPLHMWGGLAVEEKFFAVEGLLTDRPCIIFQIIASGVGGNALVTVYDGLSTSAPLVLTIEAATATNQQVPFNPPMYRPNGTFIHFNGASERAYVQYAIVPAEIARQWYM